MRIRNLAATAAFMGSLVFACEQTGPMLPSAPEPVIAAKPPGGGGGGQTTTTYTMEVTGGFTTEEPAEQPVNADTKNGSRLLAIGINYRNDAAGHVATSFTTGPECISTNSDPVVTAAMASELNRPANDRRGVFINIHKKDMSVGGGAIVDHAHGIISGYRNADPGSPLEGYEVNVDIKKAISFPEFGEPSVELLSQVTTGNLTTSVYRFNAGFGALVVSSRLGGPDLGLYGCPLQDDVFVTVRETVQ